MSTSTRVPAPASIPGATTQLVPDAHHYIHVERPDVVLKAVQAVAGKVP